MNMSVTIEQWPRYSASGTGPYWNLRVESERFHGTITWASQRNTFVRTSELMRLRRNDPVAYTEAFKIARCVRPQWAQ